MILTSKILTIKGYRSAFVKYKPTNALLFYCIKKPVNEFIKTHLLAILLGIMSQPLYSGDGGSSLNRLSIDMIIAISIVISTFTLTNQLCVKW